MPCCLISRATTTPPNETKPTNCHCVEVALLVGVIVAAALAALGIYEYFGPTGSNEFISVVASASAVGLACIAILILRALGYCRIESEKNGESLPEVQKASYARKGAAPSKPENLLPARNSSAGSEGGEEGVGPTVVRGASGGSSHGAMKSSGERGSATGSGRSLGQSALHGAREGSSRGAMKSSGERGSATGSARTVGQSTRHGASEDSSRGALEPSGERGSAAGSARTVGQSAQHGAREGSSRGALEPSGERGSAAGSARTVGQSALHGASEGLSRGALEPTDGRDATNRSGRTAEQSALHGARAAAASTVRHGSGPGLGAGDVLKRGGWGAIDRTSLRSHREGLGQVSLPNPLSRSLDRLSDMLHPSQADMSPGLLGEVGAALQEQMRRPGANPQQAVRAVIESLKLTLMLPVPVPLLEKIDQMKRGELLDLFQSDRAKPHRADIVMRVLHTGRMEIFLADVAAYFLRQKDRHELTLLLPHLHGDLLINGAGSKDPPIGMDRLQFAARLFMKLERAEQRLSIQNLLDAHRETRKELPSVITSLWRAIEKNRIQPNIEDDFLTAQELECEARFQPFDNTADENIEVEGARWLEQPKEAVVKQFIALDFATNRPAEVFAALLVAATVEQINFVAELFFKMPLPLQEAVLREMKGEAALYAKFCPAVCSNREQHQKAGEHPFLTAGEIEREKALADALRAVS